MPREHNVAAIGQRFAEALIGFSAHDDDVSLCLAAKETQVRRQVPRTCSPFAYHPVETVGHNYRYIHALETPPVDSTIRPNGHSYDHGAFLPYGRQQIVVHTLEAVRRDRGVSLHPCRA
jgi:hypothetical protein